jgi:hypothetical protein
MEVSFSSSFKRSFKRRIKGDILGEVLAKIGAVYGESFRAKPEDIQAIRKTEGCVEFQYRLRRDGSTLL